MTFKVSVKHSMLNGGKARWVTISYGDKHYHGLLDTFEEVLKKIYTTAKEWKVD